MTYCSQCGAPLADDAKFCSQCASPVTKQPTIVDAPEVEEPKTRKRRNLVLLIGVPFIVAMAGLAIAGTTLVHPTATPTPAPTEVTRDLKIFIEVNNPPTDYRSQHGCNVSGTGYDDFSEGSPITVTDGEGNVIGTDFLSKGLDLGNKCFFTDRMAALPDTAFYRISVGHRNPLTYSADQLQLNGWSATLSIGGS